MNKHNYKLVFNKHRGMLIAVSEASHNQSNEPSVGSGTPQLSCTSSGRVSILGQRIKCSMVLILMAFQIWQPAQAAEPVVITPDNTNSANKPIVGVAANGVPIIQITTPNTQGVSLNGFRDYNVPTNGLILNNSGGISQTQLGGYIQGNPMLGNTPAATIINQITGPNISQIQGAQEIAGHTANLVIANPNGISINDGGFINAQKVTLTTGTPQINNGSLNGYQIRSGQINVGINGLDAGTSTKLSILTRAAQINGQVWAKNSEIITGQNQITEDGQGNHQVNAITNPATTTAPSYALDVAAVGGMYAGQMRIIGTEQGLGVNNAGVLQTDQGAMEIDINGNLIFSKGSRVQSATEQNLKAHALNNAGSLIAGGNQTIQNSGGNLEMDAVINTGVISAGSIQMDSRRLSNQGQILQTGTQKLDLTAANIDNRAGRIGVENTTPNSTGSVSSGASSSITGAATGPSYTGGTEAPIIEVPLQNGHITISGDVDNQKGIIDGAGQINITTGQLQNQAGQINSASQLNIQSDVINNQSGRIAAADTQNTTARQINNSTGQILANELILNVAQLDNRDTQKNGQGVSAQRLQIIGTELHNQSGTINAEQAKIDVQNLRNDTGHIALGTGSSQLTAVTELNNKQGIITSAGALGIKTPTLNNQQGQLLSKELNIFADSVDNSQTNEQQGLYAQALTVQAKQINNGFGHITAGAQMKLAADSMTGDGQINSAGDASIILKSDFNNSQSVNAWNNLELQTTGNLINSGKIQAGGTLSSQAVLTHNTSTGQIKALSDSGDYSGNRIRINGTDFHNEGLVNGGDVQIWMSHQVDNTGGAAKLYADRLAISAQNLNNLADYDAQGTPSGAVAAARQQLNIGVQNLVNQDESLLYSGGTLKIGGSLDAEGLATGRANSIQNLSADIESQGAMQIDVASLLNKNIHYSQTNEASAPDVGGATDNFYVQPQGNANRYTADKLNLITQPSGRVRYQRYEFKLGGGVLGESPMPHVGDSTCTNDADPNTCSLVPGADYASSNPAWTYFKLTPPPEPPVQPTYKNPSAPAPLAAGICDTAASNYDANACSRYNAELTQYQVDKAADEAAKAQYQKNVANWEQQADAQYNALDDKITAYNQTLDNAPFSDWTQYNIHESHKQDVVLSSRPASIVAGGALSLNAASATNDKSLLLSGSDLQAQIDNNGKVDNIGAKGYHYTYEQGNSQYHGTQKGWYNWKRIRKDYWGGLVDIPKHLVAQVEVDLAAMRYGVQANLMPNSTVIPNTVETQTLSNQAGLTVSTSTVSAILPNNALYKIDANTTRPYLVETDPAFTNKRQWLGSDYMLRMLQTDPNIAFKRLGDGFYEQRMLQEQIIKRTGQRYIGDYSDNEAQYRALMDAGVNQARQFNLTVGTALTPEQMKQLTGNIVWLVEKTITLADGSTQNVLVPQLYLVHNNRQILLSDGSLIGGKTAEILGGRLNNTGLIRGADQTHINNQYLDNQHGRINGLGDTVVYTSEGINNSAGQISGQNTIVNTAGKLINTAVTRTSTFDSRSNSANSRFGSQQTSGVYDQNTYIDGMGSITAVDQLVVNVQKGADLSGGFINSEQGTTTVHIQGDVKADAVTVGRTQTYIENNDNWIRNGQTTSVGSYIGGQRGTDILIEGDLDAKAFSVGSAAGKNRMTVTGTTRLRAGEQTVDYEQSQKYTSKDVLSSQTTQTHDKINSSTAINNRFSGALGNELNFGKGGEITGLDQVAQSGINRISNRQGELNIQSAVDTYTEQHSKVVTTKGFMRDNTGATAKGIMYGKDTQTDEYSLNAVTHHDSLNYNQSGTLQYQNDGGKLTVKGVDQYAGGKDANGQSIGYQGDSIRVGSTIERKQESQHSERDIKGLVFGVGGSTAHAAVAAYQAYKDAQNTSDGTLAGAYAVTAAAKASQIAREAAMLAKTGSAGSVDVNLSLGGAIKNTDTRSHSQTEWVKPSTVIAAGGIDWNATGKEKGEGIIQMDALKVQSNGTDRFTGKQLIFGDLITQDSSQSKTDELSASAVVSYGTQGWGGAAKFSGSKTREDFNSTTHNGTHYSGKDAVFNLKDSTTLNNSQAQFETGTGNLGQLILNSEQDTRNYRYNNKSGSFEISTGSGPNLTGTMTDIEAEYNAVNSQAGFVFNDGYNLTTLSADPAKANQAGVINKGGRLVGSSDPSKNTLLTNAIQSKDIENQSSYRVDSATLSTGMGVGAPPIHDSDRNSSITRASMSDATITLTDPSLQQKLTGQTAEQAIDALNHDTTADVPLQDVFNKGAVQQTIARTQAIGSAIAGVAGEVKGWSTFSNTVAVLTAQKEKQEKAQALQSELKQWQDKIDSDKSGGTNLTAEEITHIQALTEQLNQIQANRSPYDGVINSNQAAIKEWQPTGSKGKYLTAAQNLLTAGLTGQGAFATALAGTRNLLAEQLHGEDEATRVIGHAVLACTVAISSGGDCGHAAAGAAGSVMAAPMIGQIVYPNVDPNNYTEKQRQAVSSLTTVALGVAASATGSDAVNVLATADAAKNEVENNYLFKDEAIKRAEAELKYKELGCNIYHNDPLCNQLRAEIIDKNNLDTWRDQVLRDACAKGGDLCDEKQKDISNAIDSFDKGRYSVAYPIQQLLDKEEQSSIAVAKEPGVSGRSLKSGLKQAGTNAVVQVGTELGIRSLLGVSQVVRGFISMERASPTPLEQGVLKGANFAQDMIRSDEIFSKEGREFYSKVAGTHIRTVNDLVHAIQTGRINPSQIPVDFVDINGQRLILNTRTSVALERADIPRSQWAGRNRNGQVAFDSTTYLDLAIDQLTRNKLPLSGSTTLRK